MDYNMRLPNNGQKMDALLYTALPQKDRIWFYCFIDSIINSCKIAIYGIISCATTSACWVQQLSGGAMKYIFLYIGLCADFQFLTSPFHSFNLWYLIPQSQL